MVPKKIKPVTFAQHLGAAINAVMTVQGRTQEEMVEATGITAQTFGRRIRGEAPLLVSELVKIGEVLGVRPSEILDRAIANYGGIERLMSEATDTPDEIATKRKQNEAQSMTTEQIQELDAAAEDNPEEREDEPDLP